MTVEEREEEDEEDDLRHDGMYDEDKNSKERTPCHPLKLFDIAKSQSRPLYACAPMVRYSKLPFRMLVRDYGVDLCYSPMILAKEFIRNKRSRDTEFTTNARDRPLVVQFGASNATDFGRAAEMIMPYCDGVDLNCGCPQSWAADEGIGACLINDPERICSMIRAAKARCGREFCVSVKIRIHHDLRQTVNLVKAIEHAGADYIAVHGRKKSTRSSEPVNLEAVKLVKSIASVPIMENGDVFSLADVNRIVDETSVDGVMSARGLQVNPALFSGHVITPWSAIERFFSYTTSYTIPFRYAQQHVADMMEKTIVRKERVDMLRCMNMVELVDWFDVRFHLKRLGETGFGTRTELARRV